MKGRVKAGKGSPRSSSSCHIPRWLSAAACCTTRIHWTQNLQQNPRSDITGDSGDILQPSSLPGSCHELSRGRPLATWSISARRTGISDDNAGVTAEISSPSSDPPGQMIDLLVMPPPSALVHPARLYICAPSLSCPHIFSPTLQRRVDRQSLHFFKLQNPNQSPVTNMRIPSTSALLLASMGLSSSSLSALAAPISQSPHTTTAPPPTPELSASPFMASSPAFASPSTLSSPLLSAPVVVEQMRRAIQRKRYMGLGKPQIHFTSSLY